VFIKHTYNKNPARLGKTGRQAFLDNPPGKVLLGDERMLNQEHDENSTQYYVPY